MQILREEIKKRGENKILELQKKRIYEQNITKVFKKTGV
jgi:hypothetical protein